MTIDFVRARVWQGSASIIGSPPEGIIHADRKFPGRLGLLNDFSKIGFNHNLKTLLHLPFQRVLSHVGLVNINGSNRLCDNTI